MEEITPEQKAQLNSWADQRDSILGVISALKTEKESLVKTNIELGESNAEIQFSIAKGIGRIEEIQKQEEILGTKISKEVADLITEKTVLHTEIEAKKSEIISLNTEKETILDTMKIFIENNQKVFSQTGVLEEIVDKVTTVSKANIFEVENFMTNLKNSIQGLIDVNSKNIDQTNIVIEKLPRLFFEMRKPEVIKKLPLIKIK